MTIQKLKQFPQEPRENPVTPRCQESVAVMTEHERQWRERRYGDSANVFQCTRPSVVRIGEKNYCRLHGGHKALNMLISGELIEAKQP